MIIANDVNKTSNVIQLPGISFGNKFGKKIKSVEEDFSGVSTIENHPVILLGLNWIQNGMPTTDQYKYINCENKFAGGCLTYSKLINIKTLYESGVKYAYTLGTRYVGVNQQPTAYAWQYGTLVFLKNQNNTYTTLSGSTGALDNVNILQNISHDDAVALNGNFNAYLYESIIDLSYPYDNGYYYALVWWIHHSRGLYRWDNNTEYSNASYDDIAIDRPIVRWIQET